MRTLTLLVIVMSTPCFAGNGASKIIEDVVEFVAPLNPIAIAVKNIRQIAKGRPECVMVVNQPLYSNAVLAMDGLKVSGVLNDMNQCIDTLTHVWEVRAKIAKALFGLDDLPEPIRNVAINCLCKDVF